MDENISLYSLVWYGGDLGLALSSVIENGNSYVNVSRITGKGLPDGIEQVIPGDYLISINGHDVINKSLQAVVNMLQECDLPSTIVFSHSSLKEIIQRNSTTSSLKNYNSNNNNYDERISTLSSRLSELTMYNRQSTLTSPESSPSNIKYTSVCKLKRRNSSVKYNYDQRNSAIDNTMINNDTNDIIDQRMSEPVFQWRKTYNGRLSLVTFSTNDNNGNSNNKSIQQIPEYDNNSDTSPEDESEDNNNDTLSITNNKKDDIRSPANIINSSDNITNEKSMITSNDIKTIDNNVVRSMKNKSHSNLYSANFTEDLILHEAARKNNINVFQNILNASEVNQVLNTSNQQEDLSMLSNHSIKALFYGNSTDGQTPLHIAVKNGNIEIVTLISKKLLCVNEIINIQDIKGNTALHLAACRRATLVKLLLNCGADATIHNYQHLTPLIISVITAKSDDQRIVHLLLEKGKANANDVYQGECILHAAIDRKLYKIAGLLIFYGAEMYLEDKDGRNAFEKTDKNTLKYLISHIHFPQRKITVKDRPKCMTCRRKISSFVQKRSNCTLCGRIFCKDCSDYYLPYHKFPLGFPGRTKGGGTAIRKEKKLCKTCYHVLKTRDDEISKDKPKRNFFSRVIGYEWDEINPNKNHPNIPARRKRH